MLRKLLKYEFAATGRYLLPLLCLLLVMAAAAGLSIRILSAGQAGRAAAALAAIFVVLFFLSVMALAAVTVVLIVYRFYRNLLCSEGYLMHTLPVSVHQLICSIPVSMSFPLERLETVLEGAHFGAGVAGVIPVG